MYKPYITSRSPSYARILQVGCTRALIGRRFRLILDGPRRTDSAGYLGDHTAPCLWSSWPSHTWYSLKRIGGTAQPRETWVGCFGFSRIGIPRDATPPKR